MLNNQMVNKENQRFIRRRRTSTAAVREIQCKYSSFRVPRLYAACTAKSAMEGSSNWDTMGYPKISKTMFSALKTMVLRSPFLEEIRRFGRSWSRYSINGFSYFSENQQSVVSVGVHFTKFLDYTIVYHKNSMFENGNDDSSIPSVPKKQPPRCTMAFIQIPQRRCSAISRYGKNGKYCLSDMEYPGFAIQSVEDYNTNHVKKRSFIVYYSQGLYHSFGLAKARDSAHELRPSRGVRTTSTWPAMSADL